MIATEQEAPAPSIGFPGYIYPDDATCEMYLGEPCQNDASLCCYNATNWCDADGENCQADVSTEGMQCTQIYILDHTIISHRLC